MIELVSYTEESLLPMLETAKNLVDIPVICKLSANCRTLRQRGSGALNAARTASAPSTPSALC
jgi:hypothetical protein